MKRIIAIALLLMISSCVSARDCRIMGGGYEAFLVKAGSAAMSREQRSQVIQERMNDVMSLEQTPVMRLEKQKDGSVKLWAGSVFVATVGKRDADAGPGSCMEIAAKWAEGISEVYAKAAADRGRPADSTHLLKHKKRTRVYRR